MRKCSIPGCDRKHKGKSFCQMHLDRLNRNGDPLRSRTQKSCSVDGCNRKYLAKNFCGKHYQRFITYGDPLKLVQREKGQGTPHVQGYWQMTINGRITLRHILIAEKALGRRLPNGAVVHHVDEDKSNDSNRNLVICENQSYHLLLHARIRALRAIRKELTL
jgi:hypothetical protein